MSTVGIHVHSGGEDVNWHNPNKPPGPVRWASVNRSQLNVAWEPVYWFTNDPARVRSNNRRVLEPHTEQHMKFVQDGGVKEARSYSDGAYIKRPGAYANQTEGRIPRNVIRQPHNCPDLKQARKVAAEIGLPTHGAPMPLALARFFVEFLSEKGDLVVDPFAGWGTTAKAAEVTERRWLTTEKMLEYALGGAERFRQASEFWLNPSLESLALRA